MASPKLSLKLLVHRQGPRVLFAEVPKEFVDLLFNIFSLPLGTLIELLGSNQMVGSLGKLKDSIQSFHPNYLLPGIRMADIFHNPKKTFNSATFQLSNNACSEGQFGARKAIYRCPNATGDGYSYGGYSTHICLTYATMHVNSKCPNCNSPMNVATTVVKPKEVTETKEMDKKMNRGYVKEVVTYMVMDDLVVKPMSTISSITLLSKFGVNDLSQLEEKMVSFGKDEGLKLLEASLKTDKVLTTIFLH